MFFATNSHGFVKKLGVCIIQWLIISRLIIQMRALIARDWEFEQL